MPSVERVRKVLNLSAQQPPVLFQTSDLRCQLIGMPKWFLELSLLFLQRGNLVIELLDLRCRLCRCFRKITRKSRELLYTVTSFVGRKSQFALQVIGLRRQFLVVVC